MYEGARGVDGVNRFSFGCSAAALGQRIAGLTQFPWDLHAACKTPAQEELHKKEIEKMVEQAKAWQQGGNYNPGSAVFCLLTKTQLDAKKALEEIGFEELGRTISSHIFGFDMETFRRTMDAPEVIYLMGKGWYHKEEREDAQEPGHSAAVSG
jgi:hypothetical protein